MKIWTFLFVMVGSTLALLADQGNRNSMMQVDCSSLPMTDQDFAGGLSPRHRSVFCNEFNQTQRTQAMEMAKNPGTEGMMMNTNQAVETVAKKNNIMVPSSQMPSKGCPVE